MTLHAARWPKTAAPTRSFITFHFSLILIKICEGPSLFSQLHQKRRRRPDFSMTLMKFPYSIEHLGQPHGISIPHWAPSMDGKAVAIQIDDIDVDRSECKAFFEYTGALVYQPIDAPIYYFLGGN